MECCHVRSAYSTGMVTDLLHVQKHFFPCSYFYISYLPIRPWTILTQCQRSHEQCIPVYRVQIYLRVAKLEGSHHFSPSHRQGEAGSAERLQSPHHIPPALAFYRRPWLSAVMESINIHFIHIWWVNVSLPLHTTGGSCNQCSHTLWIIIYPDNGYVYVSTEKGWFLFPNRFFFLIKRTLIR